MPGQIGSQLRRDYIWNTASSVMASASTVIMLLVVTRISGVYMGGVFALALAIGQQLQSLGMYEVRTFQATDVRRRFTFGTYHATRLFTVFLMLIGVVLYPVLTNQPKADILLIILLAGLRAVDAFEDVFLGEFQRIGRLDVAGRSYFFRVLITTSIFVGILLATHDLVTTAVITLVVSTISMLILVMVPARSRFPLRPLFTVGPIRQVLVACLPLFLAAFLAIYLSNAPKFAIASFWDNDTQGYFAIIFLPAFTINLLSTLIFRPLLTRMALVWSEGQLARFRMLVVRGLQGAAAAFALTFTVTFLIGVPLLNWLYAEDISDYKIEMLILVAGGAFNAASTILFYALTTMRRQHAVFIGYGVAAAVVLVLSNLLVARFAMMGAAWAYMVAMAILTVVFAAELVYYLRKDTPERSAAEG